MLVRANRKHSLVDGWFNIHRASGLSLQACPGPVQNLAGGGSGHVADAWTFEAISAFLWTYTGWSSGLAMFDDLAKLTQLCTLLNIVGLLEGGKPGSGVHSRLLCFTPMLTLGFLSLFFFFFCPTMLDVNSLPEFVFPSLLVSISSLSLFFPHVNCSFISLVRFSMESLAFALSICRSFVWTLSLVMCIATVFFRAGLSFHYHCRIFWGIKDLDLNIKCILVFSFMLSLPFKNFSVLWDHNGASLYLEFYKICLSHLALEFIFMRG